MYSVPADRVTYDRRRFVEQDANSHYTLPARMAAAGSRGMRVLRSSNRDRASSSSLQVLCWRTVPVRNNQIGEVARSSEPFIRQAFVVDAADVYDEDDFKRRVFALRKRSTHAIPKPGRRFYVCSLSHTVIVYKGQFTSDQLWAYFTDLQVD